MAGNADKYTPEVIQRKCAKCGVGPGVYCRGPFSAGKMMPPHAARRDGLSVIPELKGYTNAVMATKCPMCNAKPGERCKLVARTVHTLSGRTAGPSTPHKSRVQKSKGEGE